MFYKIQYQLNTRPKYKQISVFGKLLRTTFLVSISVQKIYFYFLLLFCTFCISTRQRRRTRVCYSIINRSMVVGGLVGTDFMKYVQIFKKSTKVSKPKSELSSLPFLLGRKGLMHVSIVHEWEAASSCFQFTTRRQRTLDPNERFKSLQQHLNFVISAISFNQSQSTRYNPFSKSPSHQCQTFPNDRRHTMAITRYNSHFSNVSNCIVCPLCSLCIFPF